MIDDGSPGFGVYVHWPFCAAKCPYCDFNSHVRHTPVTQADYAAAFRTEIAHIASITGPKTVTSIFLGGGTPSLMEAATLDAILDEIAKQWTVPSGIEITLEANPASADASRFRDYRALGVNRVSLGVQALNNADLRFLGRLHSVDEALVAVGLARDIFPRMSFDLIYARPGQTLVAWEDELRQAVSYAADHLSLYQLTIEDGTPFKALHAAGKIKTPDDDLAADLFDLTQDVTAHLGLPSYEVSNHAAPEAQSRHNLTYWRYGDYAGIGPGAHGRLTTARGKIATEIERMPEQWLNRVSKRGHGMIAENILTLNDQAEEMLLMGLRLNEGLDLARLEALGGPSPTTERLQGMVDLGMIERVGNARIRATAKGRPVLNAVIADLAQWTSESVS